MSERPHIEELRRDLRDDSKSASAIDKFKTALICRLLAVLYQRTPIGVQLVLSRAGFRPGDVTFRTTHKGQQWTEIHRWPWEDR